jgi:hypothetical protein
LSVVTADAAGSPGKRSIPQIAGEWWPVANNPDLGAYTADKQQPVDFAIWQAGDGTWQIWSCIRHTKCGGNTRLFYRWEGKRLADSDWMPMGIAMEADITLGESKGGLQAPHVIKDKDRYYMFYGDWQRICMATSHDKSFYPRPQPTRSARPFSGPTRTAAINGDEITIVLLLLHGSQEGRRIPIGHFLPHVIRSPTLE